MIHWLVFSVFGMNAGGNPQQCYLGLWWKIPRRLRLPVLHYAPCNFGDYIQGEKERRKESRREGEIPSTKIRNTSVTMCVKLDHFAWMAAESSMHAVFFCTTTTCCSSSCFFSPELPLDKIFSVYHVNKYHAIADFQIGTSINLKRSSTSGLFAFVLTSLLIPTFKSHPEGSEGQICAALESLLVIWADLTAVCFHFTTQ